MKVELITATGEAARLHIKPWMSTNDIARYKRNIKNKSFAQLDEYIYDNMASSFIEVAFGETFKDHG